MPSDLGPLASGSRVMVVGGGPGGCSCAMALLKGAEQRGRRLEVLLFEPKSFGAHYNQCMGVLSPPLLQVLKEVFDVEPPNEMIQRAIVGYHLYGEKESIYLDGSLRKEVSHAVRRVQFDEFLLERAERAGVKVIQSRVSDLEFRNDSVGVYSDSGTFEGDVVVGAFGSDRGTADVFSQRTSYHAPHNLETVVTKIHPGIAMVDTLRNHIHAYLTGIPELEFGALVPKGNHISIIVAGKNVTEATMDAFLSHPRVRLVLPEGSHREECFKGRFPIGSARSFFGDRYVVIGDAAGLVRPFKGKGINSAVITGIKASETMLAYGISRKALEVFQLGCRDLLRDAKYGGLVRLFVRAMSRWGGVDAMIRAAGKNPGLQLALFDSVSGSDTYRNILKRNVRFRTVTLILWEMLRGVFTGGV